MSFLSKLKGLAACLTAALCLSACSLSADVEGGDLIKKARESYTSLDSARVTMTDTATGQVEQVFTFKYDEKDTLIFSYYGKNGDTEYAQFNNGAEQFTYDNGEYSYLSRGQDGFVRYTRTVTHPQAGAGLLIYTPQNITDAKVTENEDGTTTVTHEYDVKKIGATVPEGEVTGFRAEYVFDENEDLLYFVETTDAKSGEEAKQYSYRVDITQRNAVEKVENTTEQFKDK